MEDGVTAQPPADTELRHGARQEERNAEAKRHREEDQKAPLVACRGMDILSRLSTGGTPVPPVRGGLFFSL